MNAETFANLIKNPAQLYKISYTELKHLVLQYPYCQNLRYLLLKKCVFENHQDYDENLQLAATFSNDRNNLFKQIQKQKTGEGETGVLSIKEEKPKFEETPKIRKELIQVEKSTENINIKTAEIVNSNKETIEPDSDNTSENELPELIEKESEFLQDTPRYFDENDADAEIEDITQEMEFEYDFEDIPAALHDPEEEHKNVISIEDLIELDSTSLKEKPIERANVESDEVTKQKTKEVEFPNETEVKPSTKNTPPPTPKSSFGSWVEQFQESDEGRKKSKKDKSKKVKKKLKKTDSVSKKQKKKKHLKTGKKSAYFAEQSLKVNKEIVSETLAKLLASQGSYEEAIEMFEKLRLIFPKKSSYFANQIKKLKK